MGPQHTFLSIVLVAVLASTGMLSTPAVGQDAAFTGELPDSIVVTANRYAESVKFSGRRTAVWTAADLERLPVSHFDEVLRTIGGVEVQSRGGFGVQSDLTMRGSTFNGVLVLLDGVRLNDPMTGHFLTDIPVPMSEIARIEVVRGPAAAIYGPDAVGGVVQIFTHAGAGHSRSETVEIDVKGQAGRHGLYGLDGSVRSPVGEAHVDVAASLEGAGGPAITDDGGRAIVGSDGTVRSDFARQSQTAALTQAFGDRHLLLRVGREDREFSAFHFYTPFASDTARESTATLWAHGRLEGRRGRDRWQLHGALKQHDDRYVFNPVTPANEHTSRLGQFRGFIVREISSSIQMSGGASATFRSIDSNNLGRHSDAAAGVFYSVRWRPMPSVAVTGSARTDYDEAFGAVYTPQVSAVYDDGLVGLYALAGRTVRSPNYIERFFNTTLARPRGRSLGDPNLDPERAWSYEGGASLYPASGVALHATGFLRITRDLIDYAKLSAADTVFLARNLHRVRTSGLEIDVSVRRNAGPGRLRADAAYTILSADLGDVDPGVEFKYVLTNARRLGQIMLTYYVANVEFGFQALWRQPLQGESYAVAHGRLGYRFDVGTGQVRLSGEVRNLFDREYSEVFDAPMPRRWWLLGIRYTR